MMSHMNVSLLVHFMTRPDKRNYNPSRPRELLASSQKTRDLIAVMDEKQWQLNIVVLSLHGFWFIKYVCRRKSGLQRFRKGTETQRLSHIDFCFAVESNSNVMSVIWALSV